MNDQTNNQQPTNTSPFSTATQPTTPNNPQQSASPPINQAPINPEPSTTVIAGGGGESKKRNIKIIGGVTVLLLLIIGVTVGVWALQQNQAPERSEATACSDWCTSAQDCAAAGGQATEPCSFDYCSGDLVACTLESDSEEAMDPGSDTCTVNYPGGVTGSIVISSSCSTIPFDAYYRRAEAGTTDGDCVGTNENSLGTKNLGSGTHNPRDYGPGGCGYCVQLDRADGTQGGSAQYTGDCPVSTATPGPDATATPDPTPTAVPTPTPTLPPGDGLSCLCVDIKIYDTNWNQIQTSELSQLKPGDIIKLAAVGNSSDDGITQARFIFNGNTRAPVTNKVPNKPDEFYDEITIPEFEEGQESLEIAVSAQLYHPETGWF